MKIGKNILKEVDRIEKEELYIKLRDILRIANIAVERAKEENMKYGIPEFFGKNGTVYYLNEKGKVTTDIPNILR